MKEEEWEVGFADSALLPKKGKGKVGELALER